MYINKFKITEKLQRKRILVMCLFKHRIVRYIIILSSYMIINVFYYFHFYVNVKYDVYHHLKIHEVVLNLIYDWMKIEIDHVFVDDYDYYFDF